MNRGIISLYAIEGPPLKEVKVSESARLRDLFMERYGIDPDDINAVRGKELELAQSTRKAYPNIPHDSSWDFVEDYQKYQAAIQREVGDGRGIQ